MSTIDQTGTLPANTAEQMAAPAGRAEAFTFGEPVPVLDGREILDYRSATTMGAGTSRPSRSMAWPGRPGERVSAVGPSVQAQRAGQDIRAAQAAEPPGVRTDRHGHGLVRQSVPRSATTCSGRRSACSLAWRSICAGAARPAASSVRGWRDEHEFKRGSICHLRVADINQEIYGLPEWLPALQSALLNEAATLFRRKYYQNGSHAGFILYMTDAAHNEDFVNDLRSAMRNSKGPGNFRNLFMYAPGGKKEGLQLIPISEVAARTTSARLRTSAATTNSPCCASRRSSWRWYRRTPGVRLDPRRGPGVGGQRTGAGTGPLAADQRLAG